MKKANDLARCLLLFLLGAALRPPLPGTGAIPRSGTPGREAARAALLAQLRLCSDTLSAGSFEHAIVVCQKGFEHASAGGELAIAAKCLNNRGGAQLALRRHDAALHSFQQARDIATEIGDSGIARGATVNLAALYLDLGDTDACAHWLEVAAASLTKDDPAHYLPQVQLQLATMRFRQGRAAEGMDLFLKASDSAERAGNWSLYAIVWNRAGEILLGQGQLEPSEAALLEAFRTRSLHHLPMAASDYLLGSLRLEQGRLNEARPLLDRAIELAQEPDPAMQAWRVYRARGRERLAEGHLVEALSDMRTAVRLARAWRWSAPVDDAARIATEGLLDGVYTGLIETGNQLYLATGDPDLPRETLGAAEENRAASLQALLTDRKSRAAELPAAYWTTLSQLQRAEVEALRHPGPSTEDAVSNLRADLVSLEAGVGPDRLPETGHLAARASAALAPDTCALAFHMGRDHSWLWAIDGSGDGIALYRLPPAREIADAAQTLNVQMESGSPESAATGARLHQMLFGQLDARFRAKRHWLLALDMALFQVPFAALSESPDGRSSYLAESHTTEVIPSLAVLLDQRPPQSLDGRFAGVADAIYNSADPRYAAPQVATSFWLTPWKVAASSRPAGNITLARLVSSAAEVEGCARIWGSRGAALLEGANASRDGVQRLVSTNPAVLHFAAHFLQSSQERGYGLMALSLGPQGTSEVVTPNEIAGWHTGAGLVVLSGCASARGSALPGSGVLNLTRAWLAAGAGNVVASHWPTLDDSGPLFQSFYRYLKAAPQDGVAAALQHAQLDMLRAGGWRSHPQYWGSFFVAGRP